MMETDGICMRLVCIAGGANRCRNEVGLEKGSCAVPWSLKEESMVVPNQNYQTSERMEQLLFWKRGKKAVDYSSRSVDGKYAACGFAVVQHDLDESGDPWYERVEMWARLRGLHVIDMDNIGAAPGSRRGEVKCLDAIHQDVLGSGER